MITFCTLFLCVASLHSAMANTNAVEDITATGNIDLSTVKGAQQFFMSDEADPLSLVVTATQGRMVVFTRDGEKVVKLGEAAPGRPLRISGCYDNLFVKQDEDEPDGARAPKGKYKLTFPEPQEKGNEN